MADIRFPVAQGAQKILRDVDGGSTWAEQVTLGPTGAVKVVSASFTRPNDTTAYAATDLVANSTTAGSVAALSLASMAQVAGGGGKLIDVQMRKSGTSVTNASFRVHFYKAAPATIANGDNSAWSTSGVADYIGAFDVTCDRAFTDGAFGRSGGPISGNFLGYLTGASTTLYALIEARAAYTPAAQEVYTLAVTALLD